MKKKNKTLAEYKADLEKKRKAYWEITAPYTKAKYDYAVAVTAYEIKVEKEKHK